MMSGGYSKHNLAVLEFDAVRRHKEASNASIDGLFLQGYETDVKKALNPDIVVNRYNRDWRLSQPMKYRNKYFVGKLGFMSIASEKQIYYDDKIKDFVDQAIDSEHGHYILWAIDLINHTMAFETKPPDIKYQSVLGAFKLIIDKHSELNLTIERIVQAEKFYAWAKKVSRITKFTANLRAPNPNYSNRPIQIRELLESTNASRAKVEFCSDPKSGQSLVSENTIISDLVEYGEDGYSTIVARGESDKGEIKVYNSEREMPVSRIEIDPTASVENIQDSLIMALEKYIGEKHEKS